MQHKKYATEREPIPSVIARRQLDGAQWRAAIDEKLRRRDYHLAGYEDIPGLTLAIARQTETWEKP